MKLRLLFILQNVLFIGVWCAVMCPTGLLTGLISGAILPAIPATIILVLSGIILGKMYAHYAHMYLGFKASKTKVVFWTTCVAAIALQFTALLGITNLGLEMAAAGATGYMLSDYSGTIFDGMLDVWPGFMIYSLFICAALAMLILVAVFSYLIVEKPSHDKVKKDAKDRHVTHYMTHTIGLALCIIIAIWACVSIQHMFSRMDRHTEVRGGNSWTKMDRAINSGNSGNYAGSLMGTNPSLYSDYCLNQQNLEQVNACIDGAFEAETASLQAAVQSYSLMDKNNGHDVADGDSPIFDAAQTLVESATTFCTQLNEAYSESTIYNYAMKRCLMNFFRAI